ncbi:hypothetical protein [Methanobacterium ferruginis]|uniref:hypothetical protein n=1 Tax=Methanobacterium ferruginis TaxID=710191 RepID=UPI003305FC94|nr:hypothetical protein GCM10025860_05980 [Methanobacterium ferruginis]
MKKEAMLYEKLDGVLNCQVCNRRCIISKGKTGFCGMRRNEDGILYTLNYAAASSVAVDPIEKSLFFISIRAVFRSVWEVLVVIFVAHTARTGPYHRQIWRK